MKQFTKDDYIYLFIEDIKLMTVNTLLSEKYNVIVLTTDSKTNIIELRNNIMEVYKQKLVELYNEEREIHKQQLLNNTELSKEQKISFFNNYVEMLKQKFLKINTNFFNKFYNNVFIVDTISISQHEFNYSTFVNRDITEYDKDIDVKYMENISISNKSLFETDKNFIIDTNIKISNNDLLNKIVGITYNELDIIITYINFLDTKLIKNSNSDKAIVNAITNIKNIVQGYIK